MSKRKHKQEVPQTAEEPTVSAAAVADEPADQQRTAADPEADLDMAALQTKLEEIQLELDGQRDLYIRAKAEVDNVRKRAENDIRSARKFAVEEFAMETLAVRDSLEFARALKIDEDTGVLEKMREGLDLTLRQLDNVFSKFGIQVVDPSPGDKLNPDHHQAMSMEETNDIAPNHIVSVVQKGYLIHDRLIRPAMVIVARAVSTESAVSES